MANNYGLNYNKEWQLDPAEQADKGTRNVCPKINLEEFSGVVAADVLYICKIQHIVRFVKIEALVGLLGAGALELIDKDGNVSAVAAGDLIDGAIEGGYDLVLTADGTTSAALKVLVTFLMD